MGVLVVVGGEMKSRPEPASGRLEPEDPDRGERPPEPELLTPDDVLAPPLIIIEGRSIAFDLTN